MSTTEPIVRAIGSLPAGTKVGHPYLAGRSAIWTGEVRNGMAVLRTDRGDEFAPPGTHVEVIDGPRRSG